MPLTLAKPSATRSFQPKLGKPIDRHCAGCDLEYKAPGFVPVYAPQPPSAPASILLVGEAPWYDEVALGEPLVGASGSMLTRILTLLGKSRTDYRIGNLLSCPVPGMAIEAWPRAVAQCGYLRDHIRTAPPKVIVPLGSFATRHLLSLAKGKNSGVENFHGTVTWSAEYGAWVVPTYHPSHLQRGATNLTGVMAFDLQRAHEVAEHGWPADPGTLVIDPPLEWFRAWARAYIDAVRRDGPYAYPLAVDIETPEKGTDEGALVGTEHDATYQITRVNLSCHPDEGVTVPFVPGYIEVLAEILGAGGVQYYWYKGYDVPRLIKNGMPLDLRLAWDGMWMWKVLQSDLPMGLGFAAPFYSRWGAWKHLAESSPGQYAAIDGLQTRRVGDGLVTDLQTSGRWAVFERHLHDFHRIVLQPATDVGVAIDRDRLTAFKTKLDSHAQRFLAEIQPCVPEDLRPLTPKPGLTRPPQPDLLHAKARTHTRAGTLKKDAPDPLKADLYAAAVVVEKLVLREVQVCRSCGAQEIAKTHNCHPENGARPIIEKAVATVTRWFWQEPFNPDSPPQLLAYLKAKGHAPGKSKQTGKDAVDRDTLQRLARETGDPLYTAVLNYRAVAKVRGTYVEGTFKRLDTQDRIHSQFTFKPSTMRLSAINPNITNVVADKGGSESLAAGFRDCVVARGREEAPGVWTGTRLLEADFSGIEAVLLGWFMRSAFYMRLAKLGMHAYVASHVLKRPADLQWPDADLARYFKAIKGADDVPTQRAYAQSKRAVHGIGYGMTVHGLLKNNPTLFKSLKEAQHIYEVYCAVAPDLPTFHQSVRQTAYETHQLGGPGTYTYDPDRRRVTGHPYQYLHWFWSVVSYRRLTETQRLWRQKRKESVLDINGIPYAEVLGEDAKRAIAFYPQSTARGVLTEACLALFDPAHPLADRCYIGDLYFGQTPMRAPIHDSLLLECPTRHLDRLIERVALAMQRPVEALPCDPAWGQGQHLTIGVDAKIGDDWGHTEKLSLPSLTDLGVANDAPYSPAEDADEEDVEALETIVARTA